MRRSCTVSIAMLVWCATVPAAFAMIFPNPTVAVVSNKELNMSSAIVSNMLLVQNDSVLLVAVDPDPQAGPLTSVLVTMDPQSMVILSTLNLPHCESTFWKVNESRVLMLCECLVVNMPKCPSFFFDLLVAKPPGAQISIVRKLEVRPGPDQGAFNSAGRFSARQHLLLTGGGSAPHWFGFDFDYQHFTLTESHPLRVRRRRRCDRLVSSRRSLITTLVASPPRRRCRLRSPTPSVSNGRRRPTTASTS
jgi:hypothetical protein